LKKVYVFLLMMVLTACAAPSSEPAAPLAVATAIGPLQENPPARVTATASPTPSLTATTVSPTPLPAAFSTPSLSPDDISGEHPEETGQPVIVFHQEGGFAGVDLTWTIYDNGLIVTPDDQELSVAPADINELLKTIEATGFFELGQPKPANICCDFFTFTLSVSDGDLNNVITVNDGDPNKAAGLSEAVSAVQQLIAQ